MKCKNCGKEIMESYTDFIAAYLGYVERYINCWECKTVTIFRYNMDKMVGSYPMTRYEDKTKKEA